MKKRSVAIWALIAAFGLSGCGAKGLSDAINKMAASSTIYVTHAPDDSPTKHFGDIAVTIEPVRTDYNYSMRGDEFVRWRFTFENHCNRVYRVEDATYSVDEKDRTYDFAEMYRKGFYDRYSFMRNRDPGVIEVNPGHKMVFERDFIWTYDYWTVDKTIGKEVKISLYNLPECVGDEISGHHNATWRFIIRHR